MSRLWSPCLFPSLCALLAAGLLLAPRGASAGQMLVLKVDPAESSLGFTLGATMHTVHGSLGSPSGRIAFDPATGLASGEVTIDLTRADTGIERRDRKMHEQVLATDRYPTAVYHVERVDLPAGLHQGENDLQLHGTLELKGDAHPIDVPAVATLDGRRVRADAKIEIPYVDWGLHDPSFFVLRVAKQVEVEMTIVGDVEGDLPEAAAPAADAGPSGH